ncbi:uncharacterized protein METZ01_LOCUS339368, partial [marine metagenome]
MALTTPNLDPLYRFPWWGDAYATHPLLGNMAEDEDEDDESPSEDRIIDSKAFQMGGGVDLD